MGKAHEKASQLVGDMPWVTEHLTDEQIDDLKLQIAAAFPPSEEKRLRKALRKVLASDDLVAAKEAARTEIERHVEAA